MLLEETEEATKLDIFPILTLKSQKVQTSSLFCSSTCKLANK